MGQTLRLSLGLPFVGGVPGRGREKAPEKADNAPTDEAGKLLFSKVVASLGIAGGGEGELPMSLGDGVKGENAGDGIFHDSDLPIGRGGLLNKKNVMGTDLSVREGEIGLEMKGKVRTLTEKISRNRDGPMRRVG
jgi:hypothetical protein